ncbi:MAG: inorganic phosphate transporter [Deltaproteobacteria bacterium]|nr:inorganic phosphate transporter [Deltaproteobacteria bacterium]PNV86874.1 MAG: phosphate permease [Desulfobacteraceae bacterium]MDH3773026.1 inorganic phosphate transporter [Deltaproteobacteria bacterium]MDH3802336.1 inorganic phosphate transporter [Deltaproteobacteria bacterium]MDH3926831.1 inorganic phosphate transporter [Deltaproteobacteria bacterium]
MSADTIILAAATLIGLYMAANIGANDLANAMGTSVGSGALTIRRAVIISIVANLLGAVLAGGHVTNTISKGMINPDLLAGAPDKLMLGMFAALLASGIWVHLATVFGMPVSTTHSIVGAVVGFGMLSVGVGAISWGKIITIAISWIVSPLSGAIIAGGIYYLIREKVFRADAPEVVAQRWAPYLIGAVLLTIILSFIFKGLKNLHLDLGFGQALLIAIPCAAGGGLVGSVWLRALLGRRELKEDTQNDTSPLQAFFAYLQVLTACYVAFAHGANDVANAIGPLAAIFSVVKTKSVAMQVEVSIWMLAIGGIAVGGGLFAFGGRVMETVGGKITELTPVRGFCAQFGAATTILVCSRLGLPVSTTHVLVGAVVGVGFMRGMGFLDMRLLRNIGSSWVITLPFTMVLTMVLYKLLTLFFL